jgi:hypothetical protein
MMCKISLFRNYLGSLSRGAAGLMWCRRPSLAKSGFSKVGIVPNLLTLANSLPVRVRSKNKSFLQRFCGFCTTRHSGRTFHPFHATVSGASIHHHHGYRVTPNIVLTLSLHCLLRFVFSRFRRPTTGSLGSTCSLGFCRLLFNARLFWLFRGPCSPYSVYTDPIGQEDRSKRIFFWP